ncbi:protein PF3D7_1417600 [Condylostylus longicornis]|uniref:protein PF3D7_1417600 n=1 Tax=Condylostylus longicornis TaxID=2530218 RepID=UPI00244E1464|nr:protein PF3D7_1417600 [Condylostylus longicornis]
MTQDEQHLDQSQQTPNDQRSCSIDNSQPTIPIDDDTITSSSLTTTTTTTTTTSTTEQQITKTTTKTLLTDGKLQYNLEQYNNELIDSVTFDYGDSNEGNRDNFNNNNNIPESISKNKNNSGNNQFELSTSLSASSPLNDFNENLILPENKNKITQNKNTDDVISDTPLVNINTNTLEEEIVINTHQPNVNVESAQKENILNKNSDFSQPQHYSLNNNYNNTTAILTNSTTTQNNIQSKNVSDIEANDLKNQIEFKDSFNKSVVSAVNVNSKINTTNLLQNNENLQEQLLIISKNIINVEDNNKLCKINSENQNSLESENNKENNLENKIIQKSDINRENINYILEHNEKLDDKSVNINESSDGKTNLKLNDESGSIKLIDSSDIIKSENNNNISELNFIKEESKELDNEIKLKLLDAKNNEINENLKQAQGVCIVPNQKILQEQEITENNLNFNESTKRSIDINELNSIDKNKLIDGQSDNNNNNNNNINNKDKYKSMRQKTLSQDEDPITRLNRLRANISNALREVKGVIRQYSSEQSIEIEDKLIGNRSITNRRLSRQNKLSDDFKINQKEEEMAPIADDNKPVQFRFVRKTRRSINNINETIIDQENNKTNQLNEIDNNNRNQSETNELSSENLQNSNENKELNKANVDNNNNNLNTELKNIEVTIENNNKNDNQNQIAIQSNNDKTVNILNTEKNNQIQDNQINDSIEKNHASPDLIKEKNEKINNNQIKENNLVNKKHTTPDLIEVKNEKVKKNIIKKQVAESAEEKVKKLLLKKPPVVENENNNLNITGNSVVKPKLKKIKKINSFDKDSNELSGTEKPKRIKLKKQISVDDKTLKQNEVSDSKSLEILDLLKASEQIPILHASDNKTEATELNLSLNNKNSNNHLNKLNNLTETESSQTDLVTNDKPLNKKSEETIINDTKNISNDLDDFTILLSREVIVSKVVVPQGSIEFDNPELIEFPKGDNNCKIISEIEPAKKELNQENNNLTDTSNLNKTELSKRMTISENSLVINRRASVAITDAKKLESENKQKVKTTITTQQRRASHVESVKSLPANKIVASKPKPLNTVTTSTDSLPDKTSVVSKQNITASMQNAVPVTVQKASVPKNSTDLPKQAVKTTVKTTSTSNTSNKEVKNQTSPQKEISNKEPKVITRKVVKVSPATKEITVQKSGTEVKKIGSKTVPKTFTVSRVKEPLSPFKSSSPIKVTAQAKDSQKHDGTKLTPNGSIIQNKTKEISVTSKSTDVAPKKKVSTDNSSGIKSAEKPTDTKLVKDISVTKTETAENTVISKESILYKEDTAKVEKEIEKKQNEAPKVTVNVDTITTNKNTEMNCVSKTIEKSKELSTTSSNDKENIMKLSIETQKENIKANETTTATLNNLLTQNNQIIIPTVVITAKEVLHEKEAITKTVDAVSNSTEHEETFNIQESTNVEKSITQETKILQPHEISHDELKTETKNIESETLSAPNEISEQNISSETISIEQDKLETTQENVEESQITDGSESKLNVIERLRESSHSENETTEDEHYTSESTAETTDTDTKGDSIKEKSAKKRKALKKVVIKRVKRRLSITDGPPRSISPTNSEPPIEPEICEKEIYEENNTLDEEAEDEIDAEELIKAPPKPCIRPRAFEPDELVLYGERFKKTQIKWRKARIVERITSISYKIHLGEDEEDQTVHLSFLKRDTGKRISFGGKEYLEIDYAQIEADEEKYSRPYSIWDRA